MKLSISFGALADPVKLQVEAAGLTLSDADADRFQRDADAVTHCYIRGLIGESATEKARQRIMKMLASAVSEPTPETAQ